MFPQNISLWADPKGRKLMDTTGWSAKMAVKNYDGDPDPALISLSATPNVYGSTITVLDGVIYIVIEQADMAALPTNPNPRLDWVGAYDIILIDPVGRPQYLFGGSFTVSPGVTF